MLGSCDLNSAQVLRIICRHSGLLETSFADPAQNRTTIIYTQASNTSNDGHHQQRHNPILCNAFPTTNERRRSKLDTIDASTHRDSPPPHQAPTTPSRSTLAYYTACPHSSSRLSRLRQGHPCQQQWITKKSKRQKGSAPANVVLIRYDIVLLRRGLANRCNAKKLGKPYLAHPFLGYALSNRQHHHNTTGITRQATASLMLGTTPHYPPASRFGERRYAIQSIPQPLSPRGT